MIKPDVGDTYKLLCEQESCKHELELKDGLNDKHINLPCPKCKENMLSYQDYNDNKFIRMIGSMFEKIDSNDKDEAEKMMMKVKGKINSVEQAHLFHQFIYKSKAMAIRYPDSKMAVALHVHNGELNIELIGTTANKDIN